MFTVLAPASLFEQCLLSSQKGKEILTDNNIPHGQCVICLYGFQVGFSLGTWGQLGTGSGGLTRALTPCPMSVLPSGEGGLYQNTVLPLLPLPLPRSVHPAHGARAAGSRPGAGAGAAACRNQAGQLAGPCAHPTPGLTRFSVPPQQWLFTFLGSQIPLRLTKAHLCPEKRAFLYTHTHIACSFRVPRPLGRQPLPCPASLLNGMPGPFVPALCGLGGLTGLGSW